MPSGVIKTWMDIVLALVSPWDPGSCPVTLGTRAYICLYFVGFGTQGTALFAKGQKHPFLFVLFDCCL